MSSIAFVGNIAVAPESGVTPSGRLFVRFVVAENQGHRDKASGAWVEDPATFWPVTAWGEWASNVAESLKVGDRVAVLGDTRTSVWTTPEGDKRSRVEVRASEVAAALRFARVRIARVLRTEPADSPGAPAPVGAGVVSDDPPF